MEELDVHDEVQMEVEAEDVYDEAQMEVVEAEEVEVKTKGRKRGVGAAIKDAIRNGMTNEEALQTALDEFPDAKTTLPSVAWYRNDMRKRGEKIPTARELSRQRAKDAGNTEVGQFEEAHEVDEL